MTDTTAFDLTEFFIEHDKVVLTLSSDLVSLDVDIPGFGKTTIANFGELPSTLAHPETFDTADPRAGAFEGPRGYVLKADPDLDLYVVWSDNVDNAVAYGTREGLLNEGVSPSRLARADRYGTSARWPQVTKENPVAHYYLDWDTDTLIVMGQDNAPGGSLLARSDLAAFIQAKIQGDEAAAGSLLMPIQDEDDDSED